MDHIKILYGEFNAIQGREILYNPSFGKDSWHINSMASVIRIVKFATSKNLVARSKILQH